MRSLICRLILACTYAAAAAASPAQQPARVPLFGYADATGRMVVEPIYPHVSLFFDGDWVALSSGTKTGFLNLRTGAATGLIFDLVFMGSQKWPLFAHGPEPVGLSGKWAYADQKGHIVLPARYDTAGRFGSDGLAVVVLEGRRGFIDRGGHFTMPGAYDAIWDFQNGLAVVRAGEKSGAIDVQGRLVVPVRFGFLGNFAPNGLAPASEDGWPGRDEAHYGFVDRSGRFLIPPVYGYTYGFVEPATEQDRQAPPDMARVVTKDAGEGRVGYIDATGRMVTLLPPGISGWHVGRNGLIQVQDRSNAKWGFADASGRIVIPATFDSASGFAPNGLASALVGGKWGYVGADGRFAIAPVFDSAGMFDADGRALVRQGKESRLIDERARTIAIFTAGSAISLQPSGYTAIRTLPPQIDYPVRRFGRWTLERTVYAVPEIGDMLPAPAARLRLSMLSDDGLIAWTAETEGWVLTIKTETYPQGPDRVDYNEIDVLPVGAIGLLDYFRRQMNGEFETAISNSSGDPKAQAEQAVRLRTVAARRGDYLRQLDETRPDLEAAWTAAQAEIADQFGKLSGRPCMPPRCMY